MFKEAGCFRQQIAYLCRDFSTIGTSAPSVKSARSGCMFPVTNVLSWARGLNAKRHGACSPKTTRFQNPSRQDPLILQTGLKEVRGASPPALTNEAPRHSSPTDTIKLRTASVSCPRVFLNLSGGFCFRAYVRTLHSSTPRDLRCYD
jgi:hypothetical protein